VVAACVTYPVPDPAEDEKTIGARADAIVASQRAAGIRPRPQSQGAPPVGQG